mmetsp:Transcript_36736/g.51239  ORF Transcript_36736/g.51239 Transcript_36736/m.51239 type:complete len:82 (+) Transcript_36736:87-332(+)
MRCFCWSCSHFWGSSSFQIQRRHVCCGHGFGSSFDSDYCFYVEVLGYLDYDYGHVCLCGLLVLDCLLYYAFACSTHHSSRQ